jgi:malate dehydrogenase (oxaloacetate-decarboxylating)(NADP+)
VLLARPEQIAGKLKEFSIPAGKIEFIDITRFPRLDEYADRLARLRERRGVTREDARQKVLHRNVFGALMVEMGEADGLISGLTMTYSETIRPALQIVGIEPGVRKVSGLYILILKDRVFLFADTTVNIDPSAEDLAEIALLSAATAERFGFEPRVAMISFSNFGSNRHPKADRVRDAVAIVRERRPDLPIDGEMQADTAVLPEVIENEYPFAQVRRPNVLIFPDLESANAAYKLVWRLANAEAIGPVLMGMNKPVHVLQRGVEVTDIVNMAAIAVVDAQRREERQGRLL